MNRPTTPARPNPRIPWPDPVAVHDERTRLSPLVLAGYAVAAALGFLAGYGALGR